MPVAWSMDLEKKHFLVQLNSLVTSSTKAYFITIGQ